MRRERLSSIPKRLPDAINASPDRFIFIPSKLVQLAVMSDRASDIIAIYCILQYKEEFDPDSEITYEYLRTKIAWTKERIDASLYLLNELMKEV